MSTLADVLPTLIEKLGEVVRNGGTVDVKTTVTPSQDDVERRIAAAVDEALRAERSDHASRLAAAVAAERERAFERGVGAAIGAAWIVRQRTIGSAEVSAVDSALDAMRAIPICSRPAPEEGAMDPADEHAMLVRRYGVMYCHACKHQYHPVGERCGVRVSNDVWCSCHVGGVAPTGETGGRGGGA